MRANRKRQAFVSSRSRKGISRRMPMVTIYVAMALVIGSILFDYQSVPLYFQLLQEVEDVQAQIHRLEQSNAALRQEIVLVEHDPLKLEEIARNRLGMVRPDELVYQFVVPRPSLPVSTP